MLATFRAVRPEGGGGPLNPNPGSDGMINVNVSIGSAACASGSVSRGMSLRYSRKARA